MSIMYQFLLFLLVSIVGLFATVHSFKPHQKKATILQIVFISGWTLTIVASAIGLFLANLNR